MRGRSLGKPLAPFAVAALAFACTKPPVAPRLAPGVERLGSITVTSPAFGDAKSIPIDNTCDGKDVMPELVLSSPPDGTKSLVVFVEDPDTATGAFTHMIAFNLSPDLRKIPSNENLEGAGEGARFGVNDYRAVRYSGPCPPKGELHRYWYRVVAVDTVLKVPEGSPRERIDEAIDGHVLGEGTLTGQFGH